MTIPLSVLDLAVLGTEATSAGALADTTALARCADTFGYRRFWVAEHHNMRSVAATSPPVLIAHLAAATRRIRVGSGGVMLPNHSPLVVAEQFATLEALYPGRIDLGIGRAPGADPAIAAALRRSDTTDFSGQLLDVMGLLGDPRSSEGIWDHFSATPAPVSAPGITLLGSGDRGARLAGELGIPFAFAYHLRTAGSSFEPLQVYRDAFTPSAALAKPYVIVSVSVLVAGTDDEADRLADPHRLRMLEMVTGVPPLLLRSPEEAAAHPHLGRARRLPLSLVIGAPPTVAAALAELADVTGADEFMVAPVTRGEAAVRSLSLLAGTQLLGAS
ncbi:LLM class flavin-dependent oxidoreductase [Amycolatopsis oliviviridis]|uniref:Luciferase-like domain-containing protein n=1 Tax=Amycolatopsis oliviviridis TaxID=1471590 RepID=A0ABQ3LRV6_9PSEU|nr:LLM class flavin-dependent oxidoreductase [Amycolatopsis oliviviridis]GHH24492.1 hypothetical protein GCM10017790_48900 [Amycolatopsis oliviviridis]